MSGCRQIPLGPVVWDQRDAQQRPGSYVAAAALHSSLLPDRGRPCGPTHERGMLQRATTADWERCFGQAFAGASQWGAADLMTSGRGC